MLYVIDIGARLINEHTTLVLLDFVAFHSSTIFLILYFLCHHCDKVYEIGEKFEVIEDIAMRLNFVNFTNFY